MTQGIRVLHVDDEPQVLTLAAEFLERTDERLSVATETSAAAGLERLRREPFDCIVSDYRMPAMDGLAFLQAVREHHPDLPFILFTGRGSEEVASEAISAGATDYLQKEGGTEQYELLANRIANAVESRRARGRASTMERMRSLVSDVNGALVRASTRAAIESRACEIVSEVDSYGLAVIATTGPDAERVTRREWAGVDAETFATVQPTVDALARRPQATGTDGGTDVAEPRVVSPADGTATGLSVIPEAPDPFGAIAVLALSHGDWQYGSLQIYATQSGAFGEDEQSFLVELADNIAHAIHVMELRSERERYEMIVEAAGDPVYTLDAAGRFTFVNDRLQQTTGYTEADLLGEDVSVLMDDADIESGAELIQTLLEADGRDRGTFEMEAIRADGSRMTCETRVALLTRDGEFRGTVGVVRDITARKQRERELKRYEAIMETLPVGAFSLDGDGTITEANEHAAEMVGLTRAEWIGEPFPQLVDEGIVPEGAVAAYLDGVRELLSSESDTEEFDLETVVYPREGGETRVVRALFTLLPYEEEFAGTVGVFQDLTDHRARERTLERQNDRLEAFASIVSHDIRNPLNVAQGRLELARTDCESDHLDLIGEAHERMETLIEDTLTLARQGDTVADPEPTPIPELASECWRVVDSAAAEVTVVDEFTVRGDPGRLRQVFENLFQNAVEHGGADVAVTVGRIDDEGFYVADDGPGIPADCREDVFAHGVSTTDEGTGFGLAIVAEIVRAHGWDIEATESERGGARFEITGVHFA